MSMRHKKKAHYFVSLSHKKRTTSCAIYAAKLLRLNAHLTQPFLVGAQCSMLEMGKSAYLRRKSRRIVHYNMCCMHKI